MTKNTRSQIFSSNLSDSFLEFFTTFGPQPALKDDRGSSVTYSEIVDLCNTESFCKTRRNLTFCLIDNDLRGISGYLALLASKSVPLMLSASINEDQLKKLIKV